ncbi:MAG: Gfo/Idh/MocA family protein [Planctomycetota bacterium]|jgi:predicted dehydrogenase
MAAKNKINRRQFLQSTTSLAAGAVVFPYVVPSSALGKAGTVAPSNRIVMGGIGIGWQGGINMKNFLSKKEVQFVAVCDVDKNHLEEARDTVNKSYDNQDCAVYSDFRQLIARDDIDAVSISLPDHWHAIPAIAAARAGKDIFGEKPLSHNLAEGRAICQAVQRYDRIWQTGSWQRSKPNFHQACELVINGCIGKVSKVEVGLGGVFKDFAGTAGRQAPEPVPKELDYDMWLGPAPWAPYCPARVHKNWRWHLDYGGGRIMDWTGHHVDIAHWGLGFDYTGPVEIEGWGRYLEEDLYNAVIKYEFTCTYANGVKMIISSDLPLGTKWYGEDGWLFVSRGKLKAQKAAVLEEKIGLNGTRLYKSSDHWQNFLDCIKSRQPTITPCEVAHRSASVGHLGMIAIRLGKKLKWDPDKEQFLDAPDAERLLSKAMRSPWHL